MKRKRDHVVIIVQKGNRRFKASAPLHDGGRVVLVVNSQYTNAPNTTQIASGAGRGSASGSNAAIASPYTRQQQSSGADGTAVNKSAPGGRKRHAPTGRLHGLRGSAGPKHAALASTLLPSAPRKEIVIVINDQIVKLPRNRQGSATQIASGGGRYSAGGTNAAIESRSTRQQQAVGGGPSGRAINRAGKSGRTPALKPRKRHPGN